jgi:hypothetical protein
MADITDFFDLPSTSFDTSGGGGIDWNSIFNSGNPATTAQPNIVDANGNPIVGGTFNPGDNPGGDFSSMTAMASAPDRWTRTGRDNSTPMATL